MNAVSVESWIEANPVPAFVKGSFKNAVDRAQWEIKKEAEIYAEFPLNVAAYRWNIEQAVINRSEGKSMVAAAYDYVDQLLQNL
jgi:hypothetical protein